MAVQYRPLEQKIRPLAEQLKGRAPYLNQVGTGFRGIEGAGAVGGATGLLYTRRSADEIHGLQEHAFQLHGGVPDHPASSPC